MRARLSGHLGALATVKSSSETTDSRVRPESPTERGQQLGSSHNPKQRETTMQIEGITWNGLTLAPDQFAAMNSLCREVLGLRPMVEQDGWSLFRMQNGTVLDLFERGSELIPGYGFNDGMAFGFRVDDIEAAAAELGAAGLELLCDVQRIPEMNYAYCHFRGPDGRVYGINE